MDFAATLKAEIERAHRAMSEAKSRYDVLREMLVAFERSQAQSADRSASSTPTSPALARAGALKKTAGIRVILRERKETGISAQEILDRLRSEHVPMTANALFAALSKLKQRGEAEIRGTKYFPREALLKASGSDQVRRADGAGGRARRHRRR